MMYTHVLNPKRRHKTSSATLFRRALHLLDHQHTPTVITIEIIATQKMIVVIKKLIRYYKFGNDVHDQNSSECVMKECLDEDSKGGNVAIISVMRNDLDFWQEMEINPDQMELEAEHKMLNQCHCFFKMDAFLKMYTVRKSQNKCTIS